MIGRDEFWPEKCTLMGCSVPTYRGHHHHFLYGHLNRIACKCDDIDQPGTKRLVEKSMS